MTHKFIRVLLVLVLALLPSKIMAEGKKVALVIGNADYAENSHVRPLLCPINDAKGIASKLDSLGYILTTGHPVLNGTREEILDAIDQFAEDVAYADVAVFYYSGHAISYREESYIMPIGQEFKYSSMVSRCVSFKEIRAALEKSNSGAKIMFLDACRNNPLESGAKSSNADENGGLYRIKDNIPRGTKICYATQPGKTADDGKETYSPFTQAILEFIGHKNMPLNTFLAKVQHRVEELTGNQSPCFVGEITNGFCFNGSIKDMTEKLVQTEEEKDTLYCYYGEGEYLYTQGAHDKTGKIIHSLKSGHREKLHYSNGILAIQDVDFYDSRANFCYFESINGDLVIPQSSKYIVESSFSEGLCLVSFNDYGERVNCYIGIDGNIKLKTPYYECGDFHEGLARVCNSSKSDYGKWGFIDKNGHLAIEFIYDNVSDFINGYAVVKIKGKYGIIDRNNKLITKRWYKDLSPFTEGFAPYTKDNKKWGFLDCNGNEAIPATYEFVKGFSEGLAAVCIKNDGWPKQYGYINSKGELLIKGPFGGAAEFHEGLALVMTYINRQVLYGYINKNGIVQIPFLFEAADDFYGGYAPVKKDGVRGVINYSGEFTPLHD